jgi:endonuclease/exonuclease/phosphatase (EEP) superfamily protein YafD
MALTCLQANINHCARAQDLLIQTMVEWQAKVVVVSEPYFVPNRDDWVSDIEKTVAIIASPGITFENISKGRGFVLATVDGIAVIGVYFSPNRSLADFEQMLTELGALVGQVSPTPVLVAGDFNAKSTAWGSPATSLRGDALMEWVIALGLTVLNTGLESTCVRPQGESIVDVTFSSNNLAHRVQNWRVETDVETLSDHRYIRFDISTYHNAPRGNRSTAGDGPRWVLGKLDRELAREAAIVESWGTGSGLVNETQVELEAERLGAALTRISDAAMPRAKTLVPKRRVYWWRPELRQLRNACVAARRQYSRSRRRQVRDHGVENALYDIYRVARKTLQAAIAQAKESAWEEWLETLNRDPWGRPYRVVKQKLRPWTPPLTSTLEPELVERVVGTLFPERGEFVPPAMPSTTRPRDPMTEVPAVTEAEFGVAVLKLRSKKTAPGPDGIPGRLLVIALSEMEQRFRTLFTTCLTQGSFPNRWKTGKLVLLRKDGRPPDQPSAYRPIVLLDETSKLFERVLAARLIRSMQPDLSDCQYGFRPFRSTLNAIAQVRYTAEEAVTEGGVVMAVSLDICNAFNSLPWETIYAALQYHNVPVYLQRVVAAYFAGRAVAFPTKDGWGRHSMSCGVPQGSVLGPLLWNIGYDWVLRGAMIRGVSLTCYADDTLVLARAKNHREAAYLATAGVALVVQRIRALGLEVALHKSEALVFHGARKGPPLGTQISVGGTSITVKPTMKYLGLVLDSRWKFEEHFRRLAPKLGATAGALGRILPNLGGPGSACRRLYINVVRSVALYGAPIWADTLSVRNVALLRRPQRAIALRAARAYCTVSYAGACLLAGSPPWDLEAKSLARVYWRLMEARRAENWPAPQEVRQWREEARDVIYQKWSERLEIPGASRDLVDAVRPVLQEWVERKHGAPTFHLAQLLTGHGCFGKYLCEVVGREPTSACHHCSGRAVDTAKHTREECPAWAEPRAALSTAVGRDLSLPALISRMARSEEAWAAVATFSVTVLTQKEAAERTREDDANSAPQRRRRPGRRRRAFAGRMLPP